MRPAVEVCVPANSVLSAGETIDCIPHNGAIGMNQHSTRISARALGAAWAVLALLAYGLTLSPVFYAGASASQVAQHLDLTPFPSMSNIVWGWLVKGVAALPLGPLALRLNFFSALCAAGAVYLIYRLVLEIRPNRSIEPAAFWLPETPVQVLSASMAALYLAASIPFWVVATRAHPLSYDLMLGLLPFVLVQRTLREADTRRLYLAAFVYGLGVTEYSTMMALGPLLALHLLFVLLRKNRFTVGSVLGLFGSFLLGLIPYFVAAWLYQQSPAYEWRGLDGYGQVLKYIWLEQWITLTRSLPRVGWLSLGVLTILPWAIAFGYRLAPRPGSAASRFGQTVVHLLVGGVLMGVLWDMPLSPWRGSRGEPMILLPYVFSAIGMGFVTAFLVELVSRRKRGSHQLPGPGWAIGLLLLVLPVAAALWHLPITSGRSARLPHQYASAVLNSMGTRTWLLTNGELDAQLALLAHERGQPITLINPRLSNMEAYKNYMASLFDDPRLEGLARVGLAPLLQEWLEQPGLLDQVANHGSPELWEALGLEPVPEGLVYTGARPEQKGDPVRHVEAYRGAVEGWATALKSVAAADRVSPASRYYTGILLELARMANNLGVYVEDQERADLAEALYREARVFDSNNISALINLNVLGRRVALEDKDVLARELETMVKAQEGDYTLWSLSRMHGYVRAPEIFAGRGWAWAMSGKPGMAVRELKRAIRSGGDTPAAQLALAGMYFAQEDDQASEESYRKLLAINPDHAPAILGLARLAARRGDYAEARRGIQRLRQLDVKPEVVSLEEAAIEAVAGDLAKASKLLSDLVKRQPDHARAWTALALVASQRGDTQQADLALAKVQGMRNLAPPLRLALAQMALARRDMAGARRLLEDVLRAQPSHVGALSLMTQICQVEGDRRQLEQYVNRLLSADPKNAYGNYLLGTFQYIREQYALAEASFRASLATQRTAESLNALAYLLLLKGHLGEAENLVREALKLDDALPLSWDTLANVLIKREQLEEAEKVVQKSVAMRPKDGSVQTTLVRLYAAQNRQTEAAKLADELLASPTDLSATDLKDLRAILRRIRSGG